jgi:hypothetical protein
VSRDDDGNVLVRVEHMKDGPEGAEFASRLDLVDLGADEDGDPKTSCAVVPTEVMAKAKGPKLPEGTKLALEKLQELVASDGETPEASNYIPQGVKVVPVPLWRETYKKSHPADTPDARNKAFMRRGSPAAPAVPPDKTDMAGHDHFVRFVRQRRRPGAT